MRGSQLVGLCLITRHLGQKHSTCVYPSAKNSSMVASRGSMTPKNSRGILHDIAGLRSAVHSAGKWREALGRTPKTQERHSGGDTVVMMGTPSSHHRSPKRTRRSLAKKVVPPVTLAGLLPFYAPDLRASLHVLGFGASP
jgi:hypothetical protein